MTCQDQSNWSWEYLNPMAITHIIEAMLCLDPYPFWILISSPTAAKVAATTGSKLSFKMEQLHNVPRKAAFPVSSWMERRWSPHSQPRTWSDYHHVILAALNLDPTIGQETRGTKPQLGVLREVLTHCLSWHLILRQINRPFLKDRLIGGASISSVATIRWCIIWYPDACRKIETALKDLLNNFT